MWLQQRWCFLGGTSQSAQMTIGFKSDVVPWVGTVCDLRYQDYPALCVSILGGVAELSKSWISLRLEVSLQ